MLELDSFVMCIDFGENLTPMQWFHGKIHGVGDATSDNPGMHTRARSWG